VKVAEKHVDAKLGQAASEVQSMQKALQDIIIIIIIYLFKQIITST